MWGARYFARRFWALRYFPTGGADVSAPASPHVVTLTGSYAATTALTGTYAPTATLTGTNDSTITLTGSV